MENAHAGDCGCKSPVPAGTYRAFVKGGHKPKRIELIGVAGYNNIQIHNGSYPDDFEGCFGVGSSKGVDFLGGTVRSLKQVLGIVSADGTGNITVNVGPLPPWSGGSWF
jgi:hypothetical protein